MMSISRRMRFGDWLVDWDDATEPVTIHTSLMDILTAKPGNAEQCMSSVCIRAARNEHCFPHPVIMAQTWQSRVYIVDQINDAGEPVHVVRYELSGSDSRKIHEHDRFGAAMPSEIHLRVPRDPKGSPKRAAAPSQAGRYSSLGNTRRSGVGKRVRASKPVPSTGAVRRYMVAVGALRDIEP